MTLLVRVWLVPGFSVASVPVCFLRWCAAYLRRCSRCCEPSEYTVGLEQRSDPTCQCFRFCRNLSCLRALPVGCVPLFPASPVAASQLNTRLISAAYNLPFLSFLPQLPWFSKRCHLRRSVCDQLQSLLAGLPATLLPLP